MTLILQFLNYRVAGVVPCTENIPEDSFTVEVMDTEEDILEDSLVVVGVEVE